MQETAGHAPARTAEVSEVGDVGDICKINRSQGGRKVFKSLLHFLSGNPNPNRCEDCNRWRTRQCDRCVKMMSLLFACWEWGGGNKSKKSLAFRGVYNLCKWSIYLFILSFGLWRCSALQRQLHSLLLFFFFTFEYGNCKCPRCFFSPTSFFETPSSAHVTEALAVLTTVDVDFSRICVFFFPHSLNNSGVQGTGRFCL